jgi:hypothetical protein
MLFFTIVSPPPSPRPLSVFPPSDLLCSLGSSEKEEQELYIPGGEGVSPLFHLLPRMAEGGSKKLTVLLLVLGSLDLAASISLPYPLVTSLYRINTVTLIDIAE